MKAKIQIQKGNGKITFYLVAKAGRYFLFTQRFTKGVYEFFRNGRSENEILSFRRWGYNPRLDKTIEKIPLYTDYVRRELIAC